MSKRHVELVERTLPHDLNAERAVLGAVILYNAYYPRAAARLNETRFFRDAHKLIWHALANLLDKSGGSCDLVLLNSELARTGLLDEVGGPSYVGALIDGVPRSTNVDHYATIVAEHALRRDIIYACNKAIVDAYAAEEPALDVLREHDGAVLSMYRNRGGDLISVASRLTTLSDRIEWYCNHKGQLSGVPSGFTLLDQATLGWQRGDLIIVAARPSIGKSTFALNIASVGASVESGAVPYYSMEMKREQLELRLLASQSGVSSSVIRRGFLTDETLGSLGVALNEIGNRRIYIDDSPSQSVPEIRTSLRRLAGEMPLSLVVIDYFTLMRSYTSRKSVNRLEELTEMSRGLKMLAMELSVPIVLLSQLSRKSEDRPDQQPRLSDLRECGALEQDADVVIFLHRAHHREPGLTSLILEKQRNGPTGTFDLWLDLDSTTFSEASPEQIAEGRAKSAVSRTLAQAQEKRRQIIKHSAIKAQRRRALQDEE